MVNQVLAGQLRPHMPLAEGRLLKVTEELEVTSHIVY
jgi:hypothetical protein